ncbi:MAG: DMT family transporter [Pseudomonadota bacterium]
MVAAAWMIGAIASFTLMAVAGRAVAAELDTFETMLYRSLIGIPLVIGVARLAGTLSSVTTRNLSLHAWRNIFHFTGQNLWFYALTVVPLAELFALEFTSPLWVVVFAALFLGERLTIIKGIAAFLAFAGVICVVQPAGATLNPGHGAAALSAIAFAATAIFTKKLTLSESTTCILFYITVMQAAFGIVAAGYDGDIALPSWTMLPWVIVIACTGLGAHFCLTTALSFAPASVVMPMDFVRLPVSAVVGVMLYTEPLELGTLLGAGLILLANWLNIRGEMRLKQTKRA